MATNMLASLMGVEKPVGSGIAEQGRQTLASRAYQLHVQEARANGETPMTPEQFAARKG